MSEDVVVDILRRFLREPVYWKKSDCQVSFDCPVCSAEKGLPEGDGKGNLEINYQKNVYKCWACFERNGTSGRLRSLIKRFGSSSDLEDYDLIRPDFSDGLEDSFDLSDEKETVRSLPDEFISLLDDSFDTPLKRKALYYLTKLRGVSYDIIRKYNIGFAEEGYYSGRIIIPSYDRYGEINYFSTRSFNSVKPKYLNPSGNKKDIIFNDYHLKYDFTIYLVEGAFDHIVTPNSTPLLGLEVSDEFVYKLHENASSYVVILLDGEAQEEANRIYNKINVGNLEGRVKICDPGLDLDPAEIYEKKGPRGIVDTLKISFKK